MPYTPVGWEDVPSEKTPIDADNLNHMDEQIKANADALVPASTENIGLVKPDGETITVDADGTIHGSASLPDNVVVFKDESTPSTPAPRDADTLGGFLPSHFYSGSYSTEEQVVGTWIDGKPIYRIALKQNMAIIANTYTGFTIPISKPIETMVNANIYIHQTDGSWIAGARASSGTITRGYWLYFNSTQIGGGIINAAESDSFVVVLEYTKTTD